MMKRSFAILILLLILWDSSFSQPNKLEEVKVLNFDQFEPYLHMDNDTLYLVNFWATWCAPCRKEMPAIKAVAEKYSNQPFKVLLVSLDFPSQIESTLLPYLKTNEIWMNVILLDDPNQNRWIDLVDKSWSGELPFSIIYGKDFRESHSTTFTFEQLDSIINNKLKLQ
jgi:thiol-disulfide isomerase/thioredoxin